MTMPLKDAIKPYLDPNTGFVNLRPNVSGKDSDNGLLFTAAYLVDTRTDRDLWSVARFGLSLKACELGEPGCYARYPGESTPSSFDDHLGVSVAGYFYPALKRFALDVHDYGVKHDWVWGDNELGRIPLFVPTVKACADVKLSLISQLIVAGCFIQNCFEKRDETSGINLLHLVGQVFDELGYWPVDLAKAIWRYVMGRRYGSFQAARADYFKPERSDAPMHPMALEAPKEF